MPKAGFPGGACYVVVACSLECFGAKTWCRWRCGPGLVLVLGAVLKLMACGRSGGAPKPGCPGVDGVLWIRQADQSGGAPAEDQLRGVSVGWGRGREVQDAPRFQPRQVLAGCREGKTRPARGGEERGMDGWR